MSLNIKKGSIVLTSIILILLAVFNFACSPTSTPIQPTSSPTPTATVTTPPIPPPIQGPPAVQSWEGITVETVCLKAELSFPQIEGELPERIDDTAREILIRLGLNVVSDDAPCDATLTLTLDGEAFRASYIGAGACYTGGKVEGQMTLAAEGQAPLSFPINNTKPTWEGVLRTECERLRNPEDYPFIKLWFEPLVDGMVQLWGPQVLVWAMDLEHVGHWPTVASKKLREIGATDEVVAAVIHALGHENDELRECSCLLLAWELAGEVEEAIPFLITVLDDEDYSIAARAAEALERFGPTAMVAVPALIEIIEDNSKDYSLREAAIRAMKAITGQDYGKDAALWQQWWDEHKPTG